MRFKVITAAAILALGSSMASAMTSWNLGPYTVTYDETTPVFGSLAGAFGGSNNAVGFNWDISTQLSAYLVGDGATSTTFALPSFSVTANPGYTLAGPITGFLGNVSFTELSGGSVALSAQVDLSVDGGPTITLSSPLARTETNGVPGTFTLGYFAATVSSPPLHIQSFSVSAGSLTVELSGAGPTSFASLQGQPQNQLRIGFTAAPVPEPGTYAMLLAGLGAMAFLARRRRQG